ncbi:hypothetical protein E6O75_ATG07577 [Venturia nashicola]|uniref:Uncharacterized protein n=1 Tax=Venturia nashicola TaxID=86259 RepID=A0A4Z1NVI4_9PEZI|nr:hypothetical protein E6O75_ATG07577 [Venturia nashicola]
MSERNDSSQIMSTGPPGLAHCHPISAPSRLQDAHSERAGRTFPSSVTELLHLAAWRNPPSLFTSMNSVPPFLELLNTQWDERGCTALIRK